MNEIFVFGSNLSGRHGKGAALHAFRYHGAVYGQGFGLQGSSFAIPTKDAYIKTLPIDIIEHYVKLFKIYANTHSHLTFNVTRIGCGLAGYTDEQIAPMFTNCPENCKLPDEWIKILG